MSRKRRLTSDVVADAGSEAAPPGDEDPFEYLAINAAWLHHNNWGAELRLDTTYTQYNGTHGSLKDMKNDAFGKERIQPWMTGKVNLWS